MKIAHCRLEGKDAHAQAMLLLEQLYREQTGDRLPPIETAPGGKPYFVGSHWHFSISHSQSHAFCVLDREPVGIDAEECDRHVVDSLPQRVLSQGELGQYLAAPDRPRALLTFWVLKEATVKATGEGLRRFPNQTEFRLDDPRVTEIDGCLVAVVRKKETQYAV